MLLIFLTQTNIATATSFDSYLINSLYYRTKSAKKSI